MIFDVLLVTSPLPIIALCFYTLYGLVEINKYFQMWEIKSLYPIPVAYGTLYLYIFLFQPDIEVSRVLVRLVTIFSFACSSATLFYYLKQKRGNPNDKLQRRKHY